VSQIYSVLVFADSITRNWLESEGVALPADWAKSRYLSCNWDVDELTRLKDQIIQDGLLVNLLRT